METEESGFAISPSDGTSVISYAENYPYTICITFEDVTLVIKDGADVKRFVEISKLYDEMKEIKSRLSKLEKMIDTDT
jgi:hypothetical protein